MLTKHIREEFLKFFEANDHKRIKSSDLVHFEIRSISGKIINEGTLISSNYIDVSKMNSGTYIIKIRVGNSLYRQKISITQNSR